MAYTFGARERILADGDSITSDFFGYGSWFAPFITTANTTYYKPVAAMVTTLATATTRTATATTSAANATQDSRPTVVYAALAGTTMAARLANVPSVIAALASNPPTSWWLEVGVNDLVAGVAVPAFKADAISYWALILASFPTCKLVGVSIFLDGEQHPDPLATTIGAYNLAIQQAVEGAGGTYVDTYTPAQAYEAINNVPPPGIAGGLLAGYALALTREGVHPLTSTGIPIMSNALTAVTTFVNIPA